MHYPNNASQYFSFSAHESENSRTFRAWCQRIYDAIWLLQIQVKFLEQHICCMPMNMQVLYVFFFFYVNLQNISFLYYLVEIKLSNRIHASCNILSFYVFKTQIFFIRSTCFNCLCFQAMLTYIFLELSKPDLHKS